MIGNCWLWVYRWRCLREVNDGQVDGDGAEMQEGIVWENTMVRQRSSVACDAERHKGVAAKMRIDEEGAEAG